jgi:hypothetical protein
VKTIIHPGGRRNSRPKPSQSPSAELDSPRTASPSLKPNKPGTSSSVPSTPSKKLVFDFENIAEYREEREGADEEAVVRNYVELQKRLSDELHQSIGIGNPKAHRESERLSDDFKKRLQQWDMWKASTGKYVYTEAELQKLIPSDFSKKLQEWEDIKTRPRAEEPGTAGSSSFGQSRGGGSSSRAKVKGGLRKAKKKEGSSEETNRQKELDWLEKQLEKIEGEKQRLEREMRKYCEREARLEKMREALKNSPGPKEEVWIKTPTAEVKLVGGIDEKFTKKLFQWEERQGIQPESSTMALLSPKYFTPTPEQHSPDPDMVRYRLGLQAYRKEVYVLFVKFSFPYRHRYMSLGLGTLNFI